MVAGGCGVREEKETGGIMKGHKEILLGVINILTILTVVIKVTQKVHGYIHVKIHQAVHFKHVQLTVCQLFLNKTLSISKTVF